MMITTPRIRTLSDVMPDESFYVKARRPLTWKEKLKNYFHGKMVEEFEPPAAIPNKKTIVLDLDETLIHTSDFKPHSKIKTFIHPKTGQFVFLRPGLDQFIEYVHRNFEVFIFTASLEDYAIPIINEIAPWVATDHRFFRDSCFNEGNRLVKNVSMLQRNPQSLIIVDDSLTTDQANPLNTIIIDRWKGTPDDNRLTEWLLPILQQCYEAKDVRPIIEKSRPIRRHSSVVYI